MKLRWQWFSGGQLMFWVSIIVIFILISIFIFTYTIDPASKLVKVQDIDSTQIKKISEAYVNKWEIKVDVPITYRFVKYDEDEYTEDLDGKILLGTFHEWNGTYYIDVLSDLYNNVSLYGVVIHETRHMIIEYLRDKNIIDLTKYTEEIAKETNDYYNNMFNSGIYLLKNNQS